MYQQQQIGTQGLQMPDFLSQVSTAQTQQNKAAQDRAFQALNPQQQDQGGGIGGLLKKFCA
jgi:hypothetical protein